jgi:hypothetical protein
LMRFLILISIVRIGLKKLLDIFIKI